MKRHKWEEEQIHEYGTKPHTCVKCGIRKNWWGGDFQCWQYTWFITGKAMNGESYISLRESFHRPECK